MPIEWWHPFRLRGGCCSLCRGEATQAARGLTSSGGHRCHCKEHRSEVHVHRRAVCCQVLAPCSAAHIHATVPTAPLFRPDTSTSVQDPVAAWRAATANQEVACTYIGEPAVRGTLVLRSEKPHHPKQVGQDLHAPAHAGMTFISLSRVACAAHCKRRKQRGGMRTRPQNRISPT